MTAALDALLNQIRNDTKNGAATLVGHALDALQLFAENCGGLPVETGVSELRRLVHTIHGLRPAMAAIGVQALLVFERVMRQPLHECSLSEVLLGAVAYYRQALASANDRIANHAENEWGALQRIATCSFSTTLMDVFEAVGPGHVFVGDGWPLGDGIACAEALRRKGIHTTLMPDGALPSIVGSVDVVMLGADQILIDGSVVNRAGSFPLAVAAFHYGVPVIVLCQKIKISGDSDCDALEEVPDAGRNYPDGVPFHAPLFDVTPARYISEIIIEDGVLGTDEVVRWGREIARLRRNSFLCN